MVQNTVAGSTQAHADMAAGAREQALHTATSWRVPHSKAAGGARGPHRRFHHLVRGARLAVNIHQSRVQQPSLRQAHLPRQAAHHRVGQHHHSACGCRQLEHPRGVPLERALSQGAEEARARARERADVGDDRKRSLYSRDLDLVGNSECTHRYEWVP